MRQNKIYLVRAFMLISLFLSLAYAEEKKETEAKKKKTKQNKFIQTHEFASHQLMRLTNWFDSFFGNKKYLLGRVLISQA